MLLTYNQDVRRKSQMEIFSQDAKACIIVEKKLEKCRHSIKKCTYKILKERSCIVLNILLKLKHVMQDTCISAGENRQMYCQMIN